MFKRALSQRTRTGDRLAAAPSWKKDKKEGNRWTKRQQADIEFTGAAKLDASRRRTGGQEEDNGTTRRRQEEEKQRKREKTRREQQADKKRTRRGQCPDTAFTGASRDGGQLKTAWGKEICG